MAQHEEPLYDFPEPTQPSARKFLGHHRSRGSLRSISVLDRLLLTVPVWFQLSINPATALHILQREPPGVRPNTTCPSHYLLPSSLKYTQWSLMLPQQTFLVRKSRTSQRNVLCVRLTDDSVPSFVQQFGIREEHSSKNVMCFLCPVTLQTLVNYTEFLLSGVEMLSETCVLPNQDLALLAGNQRTKQNALQYLFLLL